MLIDWFTVAAQLVNFLILIWLLKRFLYRPILDAIDAREKRIADELAQADATRADALKERQSFEAKSADIDRRRAELLRQADEDAGAERKRLVDAARAEISAMREQRARSLRDEAQALQQSLVRQAQHEVFEISRKALGDLADERLESRFVAVLAARLHALGNDQRASLAAAFRDPGQAPVVRSAFELTPADRQFLQQALRETLDIEREPRFEAARGLVGGIEIVAGGRRIGWSIAQYLEALKAGVDALARSDGSTSGAARAGSPAGAAHPASDAG